MKATPMSNLFLAMYSPPGCGKTLANVRAFPEALFVAPTGALNCASYLGYNPPRVMNANGIRNIPDIIAKAASKVNTIVFSDLSIEADNEAKKLRTEYSGWTVWDKYGDFWLEARDAAREAQCNVIWEFHESPPREIERGGRKVFIPGTFSVSGFKATEKIPGMMDTILRVVSDASNPIWPYVFSTEPSPDYVTKDRTNTFPARFPMNLREPLLLAGYDLPRPKELAWMESAVEELAVRIAKEESKEDFDLNALLKGSVPSLKKRAKDPRHIRWVMSDAIDRVAIRKSHAQMLDSFIDDLTTIDDDSWE